MYSVVENNSRAVALEPIIGGNMAKKKIKELKNFSLEGETLKAEKHTSTYITDRKNGLRKCLSDVCEPQVFKLEEAMPETLSICRKDGIPYFVLKEEGKLYYTVLPKVKILPLGSLMNHRCSSCYHLSAASDANGGCAKVREFSLGIEKYSFIVKGYETVGASGDVFIVQNCENYEPDPPRREYTAKEITHLKLALAQNVWDDISSMPELKRRVIEKIEK